MEVHWEKFTAEEIRIRCPICGHQTVPPEYPYCEHTLFVYIDPSADDPFFDFLHMDISRSLGADFDKRGKLQKKLIMNLKLPYSCQVYDVTESSGYYPTRIVTGFSITRNSDD